MEPRTRDPLADQVLHIQLLQEKQKIQRSTKKPQQNQSLLEREGGFNTYFGGANEERAVRLQQQRLLQRAKQKDSSAPRKHWGKPSMDSARSAPSNPSSPPGNYISHGSTRSSESSPSTDDVSKQGLKPRSKWAVQSIEIKTDSGQRVKLRPPTSEHESLETSNLASISNLATEPADFEATGRFNPLQIANAADSSLTSTHPSFSASFARAQTIPDQLPEEFEPSEDEDNDQIAQVAVDHDADDIDEDGSDQENPQSNDLLDEYDEQNVSLSLRRGDISFLRQSLQTKNWNSGFAQLQADQDQLPIHSNDSAVDQSKSAKSHDFLDENQEDVEELEAASAAADVLQAIALETHRGTYASSSASVFAAEPASSASTVTPSSLSQITSAKSGPETDLRSSVESAFLSSFLPKLQSLDERKRRYLMQVLEKLESGDVDAVNPKVWSSFEQHAQSSPITSSIMSKSSHFQNEMLTEAASSSSLHHHQRNQLPSPTKPLKPVALVFPAHEFRNFKQGSNHSTSSSSDPCEVSSSAVDSSSLLATPNSWTLTLRLLSTWGHTSLIGLTQVEVLDAQSSKIRLAPSCVQLEGRLREEHDDFNKIDSQITSGKYGSSQMTSCPPLSRVQIGRLLDGNTKTTNERHMWSTHFPHLTASDLGSTFSSSFAESCQLSSIDLNIHYTSTAAKHLVPRPTFVKLWNYNRSIEDISKGVRDAEIYLSYSDDGSNAGSELVRLFKSPQLVWKGQIKPGVGNAVVDYSTLIELSSKPLDPKSFVDASSFPMEESMSASMPASVAASVPLSSALSSSLSSSLMSSLATVRPGTGQLQVAPNTQSPSIESTHGVIVSHPGSSSSLSSTAAKFGSLTSSLSTSISLANVKLHDSGSSSSGASSISSGMVKNNTNESSASPRPVWLQGSDSALRSSLNIGSILNNQTALPSLPLLPVSSTDSAASSSSTSAFVSTRPGTGSSLLMSSLNSALLSSSSTALAETVSSNHSSSSNDIFTDLPPPSLIRPLSGRRASNSNSPVPATGTVSATNRSRSVSPSPFLASSSAASVLPPTHSGSSNSAFNSAAVNHRLFGSDEADLAAVAQYEQLVSLQQTLPSAHRSKNVSPSPFHHSANTASTCTLHVAAQPPTSFSSIVVSNNQSSSAKSSPAASPSLHPSSQHSSPSLSAAQLAPPANISSLDSLSSITSSNLHPAEMKTRIRSSQLQASIDSLAFFEQHHLGRLAASPVCSNSTDPAAPSSPEQSSSSSSINPAVSVSSSPSPNSKSTSNHLRKSVIEEVPFYSQLLASSLSSPFSSLLGSTSTSDPSQSSNSVSSPQHQNPDASSSSSSVDFSPETFVLPTLPRGKQLVINILSTWGDPHYVGLNGIELFGSDGRLIQYTPADQPNAQSKPEQQRILCAAQAIRAHPSSVNDLPGYGNDPRVVSNLLDGVNATCDDLHVWLAPFSYGKPHLILIDLPGDDDDNDETREADLTSLAHPTTLSMLRIWNYNKNRIHSTRGARHVQMFLDSHLIFVGELARAPGTVTEASKSAELIVFTSDYSLQRRLADSLEQVDMEARRARKSEQLQRRLHRHPLSSEDSHGDENQRQLQQKVLQSGVREELKRAQLVANAANQAAKTRLRSQSARPADPKANISKRTSQAHQHNNTLSTLLDPALYSASEWDAMQEMMNSSEFDDDDECDDMNGENWVDSEADTDDYDEENDNDDEDPLDNSLLIERPKTGDITTTAIISSTPFSGAKSANGSANVSPSIQPSINLSTSALDGLELPSNHPALSAWTLSVAAAAEQLPHHSDKIERPHTSANIEQLKPRKKSATRRRPQVVNEEDEEVENQKLIEEALADQDQACSAPEPAQQPSEADMFISRHSVRGSRVLLQIRSTHGDMHFVGMTAISVLCFEDNPEHSIGNSNRHSRRSLQPVEILLDPWQLEAFPRDINSVPGHSGDCRTLEKLVDGVNNTCDDTHMWLCPFLPPAVAEFDQPNEDQMYEMMLQNPKLKPQPQQWLAIDLGTPRLVCGLRVYNYNKSTDDTCRGVRAVDVFVDDVRVSPESTGLVFRAAPGHSFFDFGQTILFDLERVHDFDSTLSSGAASSSKDDWLHLPAAALSDLHRWRADIHRWYQIQRTLSPSFVLPLLPCGFLLRMSLLSTWGDVNYIGLNGIELYDHRGRLIPIDPQSQLAALPESVAAALPNMQDDVRVLANLVDGCNQTWDARHMWLAPYAPMQVVQVFINFDQPIALSMIKFWNYSRTPTRGVQEVQIFLDDQVIWHGSLKRAPELTGKKASHENFGQTILFTSDETIVQNEKQFFHDQGTLEQEVSFFDNRRIVKEARAQGQPLDFNMKRPHTSVPRSNSNHS